MRILIFLALTSSLALSAFAQAKPVRIQENVTDFVLDNGLIETVISKKSGSMISAKYKGQDLLATGRSSGEYAMWSHDATSPDMVYKVTIDPASNGGKRGEISIKGISKGRPMGNGPGGSFIADIEVRYALEEGLPGIYTYTVFDHLPEYPASSMGEARFVAFLHKDFDWMSVDEKRSRLYRLKDGELDLSKYQYTANQHENPVFGWINTSTKTGFWLINATMEYMSGGPTKVDFLCHRDTRINGLPVFLNYWRSSHYGGSSVEVAAGEKWSKMIGPILLYANTGDDHSSIKQNALARGIVEKRDFPYKWVDSPDFPRAAQRSTVKGKLAINDPVTKKYSRLRVGLTAPDYDVSQPNTTVKRTVDWQWDAKNYQFWTVGDVKGDFQIDNVRPGKYTRRAIADGVLGEYAKTDISVEPGKNIDLGTLTWTPVRRGKQIWEIGVSNRNGSEFLGGDRWYEYDILKRYRTYLSNDVNFTIGKSDPAKDWYYVQVPRVDDPNARESNEMPEASRRTFLGLNGGSSDPKVIAATLEEIEDIGRSGKYALGKESSWNIHFDLRDKLTRAVLRIAICGNGARELAISVNGKSAGKLSDLRIDGTPNRNGNHGLWNELFVTIDTTWLTKGDNTITLTIPGGQLVNGIMYDYIRLEGTY